MRTYILIGGDTLHYVNAESADEALDNHATSETAGIIRADGSWGSWYDPACGWYDGRMAPHEIEEYLS